MDPAKLLSRMKFRWPHHHGPLSFLWYPDIKDIPTSSVLHPNYGPKCVLAEQIIPICKALYGTQMAQCH